MNLKYKNHTISFNNRLTLYLCISSFTLISSSQSLTYLPTTLRNLIGIILFILLLEISYEDIKSMLIPPKILLMGTLMGLAATLLSLAYKETDSALHIIFDHLLASISSFLIMISISFLGKLSTQKDVLGIGDAKLCAMGGLWIGLEGILNALIISFVTCGLLSLIARILRLLKPFQPFPFAPFISLGVWCIWTTG